MSRKKITIAILTLLITIKFLYIPWTEWANEIQSSNNRLSSYYAKQEKVIENEVLISQQLKKHKENFSTFVKLLPEIKAENKTNTLWFSLVDSVKSEDIKVYSQKVDFEEKVTDNIGYVTGSFNISGAADDVIKAIVELEAKAPYVFLEKLKLTQKKKKKNQTLIAQLYLRKWFIKQNGELSEFNK